MIALGLDPGFKSLGWAHVRIDRRSEMIADLGLLESEKRGGRATDDNVRRTREIARALSPLFEGVDVVCCEAMSFPRSASVAAKMALAWGVIVCLAEARELPIVQVTPQALKIAVCGDKTAPKEAVLSSLSRRYPELLIHLEPLRRTAHEHPTDAVGAVVASLPSELVRGLRRRS